ncbi:MULTISPECIES: hypothetical protein [Streptomyces]|uniref:hypothetical protein n=1 Tax=Streptomyces TaxID=1883 RepID=UPI00099B4A34|nr:hypothetical protein [Streptomyces sp. NRRL S-4]
MATPPIPDDLVQAERERHAAYRALAIFNSAHNTALRRRLLKLSATVWWHPYWNTVPGRASAARMELRTLARKSSRSSRAA